MEEPKETQSELPKTQPISSLRSGSVGRSTSNRLSSTIAQFEQQSHATNNQIPKRPPVKLTRQLPVPPKSTGNNIDKFAHDSNTNSSNSSINQRPKSRTISHALAKQLSHNGEDKPADIREIFANTNPDNNNNTSINNQQEAITKTDSLEQEPQSPKSEIRRSRGVSESHVKRAAVYTTIRISKEKIDSQLSKPLPAAPLQTAKSLPTTPTTSTAQKERIIKSSSTQSGELSRKPLPHPTAPISISSYPPNSDTSQIQSRKPLPTPSKTEDFVVDTNVDISTKKALPPPSPGLTASPAQVSMDDSSINYQSNHTLGVRGRKLSFRSSLDSRKEKDPPGEEAASNSTPASANQRERSKTLKRIITNKLFTKDDPIPISHPSPIRPESVRPESASEPVSPSEPSMEQLSQSPTKERTKSARKLPQFKKDAFKFLKGKKNVNNKLAEHLREAEGEIGAMFGSLMEEFEKMDIWTTRPHADKNWNEVEQEEHLVEPEIRCLLNIDRAKAEGFHFEFGRNFIVYTPMDKSGELIVDVEDAQKDIPYYLEFFADKSNPVPQFHYMNDGEEDKVVGPIVITIEAPTVQHSMNPISSHMSFNSSIQNDEDKRAIIRTKKGTERIFIPASQCTGKTSMIKYIKSAYPDLSGVKLTKMPPFLQDSIEKKLIEFEKQSIFKRYKFGLLYVKDGQTDENEMFSNNEPSPDYEEFMAFLGEKITLKGWSKYRGGLDVKTNTTGTHSIYTEHRGYEIMFHVSNLLPFQPDDLQRVERKRHLGNDVVVLIYKEGDTPFDPLCLTTHFNHVFVVVQKETTFTKITHYRICVANKLGVPPYSPYLSSPAIYPKNDEFRDFLLTKCNDIQVLLTMKVINGERAAMYAPDFRGKMLRTNKTLLEDMAKDFIQKSKEKPKAVEKAVEPAPSTSPSTFSNSLAPPTATGPSPEKTSSAPSSNRSSRSFAESPVVGELN